MSNIPRIKTQTKVQAYEGISLQTIQQKGSDGQKIMAPLFDVDGNGKLEGNEVKRFNNCIFKTEQGKITMYDRSKDFEKKPFVIEITYNKEPFTGNYDGLSFTVSNKNGNKKLNVIGMAQGNIKVNLTNGKAIFDNVNPVDLQGVMVKANNMDIIEKSNSFIGPLDLNGGEYYPAI